MSKVTEWFNTSSLHGPERNQCGDGRAKQSLDVWQRAARSASIRQQGVVNFDFAVFKRTTIYENMNLEFRAEFFNLFNHPQFGPPNGAVTSSTFGQVTNTVNLPRLVQFGLKLNF